MRIYYDIFEKISNYIELEDVVNFLLVNKTIYENIFLQHNYYCNRIFAKKILTSCGFDTIHYGKFADKTKILFEIYNYFKNHKGSGRSDFLMYMIDNAKTDLEVFNLFASKCIFRNIYTNAIEGTVLQDTINNTTNNTVNNTTNNTVNNTVNDVTNTIINTDDEMRTFVYSGIYGRNITIIDTIDPLISFDDMKYMMSHCSNDQLKILFSIFDIPISIISYTINEILMRNCILNKRDELDSILKTFVKYIFVKHCFGSFSTFDNTYIHSIILCLIKYKRTNILRYFLSKKRRYMMRGNTLDYQYLVNNCVENLDKIHLQILLDENRRDNQSGIFVKSYVIINTHFIINHCKNAKFDYISFLAEKYLGRAINTHIYIDSICQGIELLILSKNTKDLVYIHTLAKHISVDNRIVINKYIHSVYNSQKIIDSKRIFLDVDS
jgi:hypothetical protein